MAAGSAPSPLPALEVLLASGGDERIAVDAATGLTRYGCPMTPQADLFALGSSTASAISATGFAAAQALRATCVRQLRRQNPADVYAAHTAGLRAALLRLCGCGNGEAGGVGVVLAASGTDSHLLAAQLFRPRVSVMIAPCETGSGLPNALRGRHFSAGTAYGGAVTVGATLNNWHGELRYLAVRAADGAVRDTSLVDADCAAEVGRAAGAGQSVLLVLTDVSKTGLVAPSLDTALALQRRWPGQVEVLVDACQFRLCADSVRAYLQLGWAVALTGSKFMSGPTFCGALLLPAGLTARLAARRAGQPFPPGLADYSSAADWPADVMAALSMPAPASPVSALPATASPAATSPAAGNFGLLLRWQAALAEMARFAAVPDAVVTRCLRAFAEALRGALAGDARFEALPVAPICRRALAIGPRWDLEQSIFPFLLFEPDAHGGRRPLHRDETRRIYLELQQPSVGHARFQLGQPVQCGTRHGVEVSALRLCVSARMLADAHAAGDGGEGAIAAALAALEQIRRLLPATRVRCPETVAAA